MIYQFESRVRYSEVDREQNLTLPSIINYFQDCSTFHSEAIGLGIENLGKKNRAWILSSWQIVLERAPRFGEKILVQTWPYDFKGFYGYRNFALLDETGRKMAYANSVWVFMDLESGHPVKVSEEEAAGYVLEERLDMEYAPRKIPIPKESVKREPRPVQKYQLDTNDHVNNGQYVLLAHEFLPEGFAIGQMRAEYKKAAHLHDVIVPWVHEEEERYTVALCDEGEKPYAVVTFEKQKVSREEKLCCN